MKPTQDQTVHKIVHICGCSEEHSIAGNPSECSRQLKWLQSRPCTPCWIREEDKKRSTELAQAKVLEKENNWPDLAGTEKQIAWATCIRKDMIEVVNTEVAKLPEEQKTKCMDALRLTLAETDNAKWYIDNRTNKKALLNLFHKKS